MFGFKESPGLAKNSDLSEKLLRKRTRKRHRKEPELELKKGTNNLLT